MELRKKLKKKKRVLFAWKKLDTLTKQLLPCGHIFCSTCINDVNNHTYGSKIKCAICRHSYNLSETVVIKGNIDVIIQDQH